MPIAIVLDIFGVFYPIPDFNVLIELNKLKHEELIGETVLTVINQIMLMVRVPELLEKIALRF